MNASSIVVLAVVIAVPAFDLAAQSCDRNIRWRGNHTSVSSRNDSDDDFGILSYSRSRDGQCESATIVGKLTYTDEEDDILSMPFGSHAAFRERTSSVDRALSFTRDADGRIIREFELNGRTAPFDADAKRWLADFLPRVLAQASVNVKPRVARWRAQGGIDNVLRNIESLGGSGAMRSHYDAFLDGGRLSDDDMERTLRSASVNMRGSSGDMRYILSRLAPTVRVSPRSIGALESAFNAMASSGDKSSVIMIYGQSADRELLAMLMRAAEDVPSSGDKSRVLTALAPKYLSTDDVNLESAWFGVARGIPSSGDLRRVMTSAVQYAPGKVGVTRSIIRASSSIASSGDRSSVLLALVSSGAVNTSDLRDAFFAAASNIPSEGDRSRVLLAAARQK